MRRRSLLRALALSAVGLAGCASADDERGPPPTRPPTATDTQRPTTAEPTEPPPQTPTPSPYAEGLRYSIAAVSLGEGEGGLLAATIPVENATDGTVAADLVVTVEADDTYTTRERISVAPATTEDVTVTFDAYWADVGDGAQVRELFLLKPGATV
jgi:glucose/arabinose dehydrogenase